MSLQDLIAADAESVFLNTEGFAQEATHRPLGNSANDVSRTVDWNEQEPERSTERGDETVRRVLLHVAADVSVDPDDLWIKDSETWATKAIQGVVGGLRRILLERHDTETRSRGSGTIL
jgi:hypothetical protein